MEKAKQHANTVIQLAYLNFLMVPTFCSLNGLISLGHVPQQSRKQQTTHVTLSRLRVNHICHHRRTYCSTISLMNPGMKLTELVPQYPHNEGLWEIILTLRHKGSALYMKSSTGSPLFPLHTPLVFSLENSLICVLSSISKAS